MADNGIGYTFQPGSQQIPVGDRPQSNGPQSAVQVKSFTLPNRFVPGQIAPQALLQSPGGGGLPNVDILRRLMSLFAPQGQQQGVSQLGQAPTQQPRFHTQPVPMQPEPQAVPPFGAPPLSTRPVPRHPSQPDVPQAPSAGAPPRVIPGGDNTGANYNPYTDTANFAPAQPAAEPLHLPAVEGYNFGTTPQPSVGRTPNKFDNIEGFDFSN